VARKSSRRCSEQERRPPLRRLRTVAQSRGGAALLGGMGTLGARPRELSRLLGGQLHAPSPCQGRRLFPTLSPECSDPNAACDVGSISYDGLGGQPLTSGIPGRPTPWPESTARRLAPPEPERSAGLKTAPGLQLHGWQAPVPYPFASKLGRASRARIGATSTNRWPGRPTTYSICSGKLHERVFRRPLPERVRVAGATHQWPCRDRATLGLSVA
jgi:hypothetical protein